MDPFPRKKVVTFNLNFGVMFTINRRRTLNT